MLRLRWWCSCFSSICTSTLPHTFAAAHAAAPVLPSIIILPSVSSFSLSSTTSPAPPALHWRRCIALDGTIASVGDDTIAWYHWPS